jgi:putative resolvase
MKLSTYAKTASQWWKAGQVDASHLPSGVIMGREAQPRATCVALSARVASAEHKADVPRQLQRLREYAAARGDQVMAVVTEMIEMIEMIEMASTTSGPSSPSCSPLRVGVSSSWSLRTASPALATAPIAALLERAGRRVEALSPSDTDADLVDDLVAVITRLATRLYGQRRAARMQACVAQCIEQAEQVADT